MPDSLKLVAILLGLGVVGALASGIIQHRESELQAHRAAEAMTGGRVAAGQAVIARYGCGACHVIPGISEASGRVGPSLRAFALRAVIAGRLSNDPANLALWVRHPQQVVPGNAMPDQRVTAQEARDISAYLYTLR